MAQAHAQCEMHGHARLGLRAPLLAPNGVRRACPNRGAEAPPFCCSGGPGRCWGCRAKRFLSGFRAGLPMRLARMQMAAAPAVPGMLRQRPPGKAGALRQAWPGRRPQGRRPAASQKLWGEETGARARIAQPPGQSPNQPPHQSPINHPVSRLMQVRNIHARCARPGLAAWPCQQGPRPACAGLHGACRWRMAGLCGRHKCGQRHLAAALDRPVAAMPARTPGGCPAARPPCLRQKGRGAAAHARTIGRL